MIQRIRGRVNVKSLANESRLIRHEVRKIRKQLPYMDAEQKAVAMAEIASLDSHRTWKVRGESRIAHLAISYLNGTPYSRAESNPRQQPSKTRLVEKLKRWGCYSPELSTSVDGWLKS